LSELWKSYFPLLDHILPPFGKTEECPWISILDDKYWIKDLNLLDIKAMAEAEKDSPFSNLFPSKNDPAYKHWPRLEQELKKGKPVPVMEYFINEDEKVFSQKYDELRAEYSKAKCLSKQPELTDLFIKKIKRNPNSITYDRIENNFKTDFSAILEFSAPISIYAAFRCFVPIKYVYRYISKNQKVDYDYFEIIKWLISFTNNYGYYIPIIEKEFKSYLILDEKKNFDDWSYYKNKIFTILSKHHMDKEKEEFQKEWEEKGIDNGITYISKLIGEQKIANLFESVLKDKIGNHFDIVRSLSFDKKTGEDKTTTIGESVPDEKNNNEIDKLINKISIEEYNLRLIDEHLAEAMNALMSRYNDEKLEIMKKEWEQHFEVFKSYDKYKKLGEVKYFDTVRAFEKFIYWIVPYLKIEVFEQKKGRRDIIIETRRQAKKRENEENILRHTERLQRENEQNKLYKDQVFQRSDLFKDYCTAEGIPLTVDLIKKCRICEMFPKNEIEETRILPFIVKNCKSEKCKIFRNFKLLKTNYRGFKTKINEFIKLIEDDGKNNPKEDNLIWIMKELMMTNLKTNL